MHKITTSGRRIGISIDQEDHHHCHHAILILCLQELMDAKEGWISVFCLFSTKEGGGRIQELNQGLVVAFCRILRG
jgi:hypothetical protein